MRDKLTVAIWSQDFSVGHALLDSQHKALLALCQQAADCMDDHSLEGVEHFHVLLNDLAVYARQHFRAEEKILSECNCPLLSEQVSEHEAYEVALSEFLLAAMRGEPDKDAVHQFLAEWWTQHILGSDMRYSEFLREVSDK